MRRVILVLGIICVLATAAVAAKPKVITFGRWLPVKWVPGAKDDISIPLKVRALMVNSDVKGFTTGEPHQVTDRIFVVRSAYRLNDSLPEDGSVQQWKWQPAEWLLVDRTSAHIAKLSLPDFDFLYSTASWYRDYVAYCGISSDGEKVYAVVAQIGQKKPILKKPLGEAKDLEMPDSQCAAPVWQKQPMRVTFAPNGGEKISVEIRGHAAELETSSGDDE